MDAPRRGVALGMGLLRRGGREAAPSWTCGPAMVGPRPQVHGTAEDHLDEGRAQRSPQIPGPQTSKEVAACDALRLAGTVLAVWTMSGGGGERERLEEAWRGLVGRSQRRSRVARWNAGMWHAGRNSSQLYPAHRPRRRWNHRLRRRSPLTARSAGMGPWHGAAHRARPARPVTGVRKHIALYQRVFTTVLTPIMLCATNIILFVKLY